MDKINEALIKYLKKNTPREWHQTANGWNWDSNLDVLKWIIFQKECDKATALLIYWRSIPHWTHQYLSEKEVRGEKDLYNLNFLVEKNYMSGFYTYENIRFDPNNDNGFDWTREYQDLPQKQKIPEVMFKAISGVVLPKAELIEGYPKEIYDQFYQE